MLRRLQAFFVLGVCIASASAAAQEPTDEPAFENSQLDQTGTAPAASEEPTAEPASEERQSAQAGTAPAAPPAAEAKPVGLMEGWHTEVTGYFRAPAALGISTRPGPDTRDPVTNTFSGPVETQVSYGPTRTVDSSYYSFAYTTVQEQDWVEVAIHAKKKHVDAAVGWMGYWYGAVGFRNLDAAWIPGIAYLKLDTDVEVAPSFEPNIALTVGAWWPRFGYFAKYDTFTLGQFRQLGEQLKLTLPLNPDFTLAIVQGFGTGRDGKFNVTVIPPIYGAVTGLDLLHYEHIQLTYKEYVDVGLHYNNEWTDDPNLWQQGTPGKSYTDVSKAHLSVVGAEAGLSAPYAGRLWISPSYISVRNGWALGANGGTEVMHSMGGAGIASNYMAFTNSPADSTGSGSMLNIGLLYENSLSRILDKTPGSVMPEVTLNVFGLLTTASLDLPDGSTIKQYLVQDKIKQFKYGADVTVQPLNWLAFMLRYDTVNLNTDQPGYIFSFITPRLVFSSHFLSGESIYIQYTRYFYGDRMVIAGIWPWGTPLVAGSDILQGGPYTGHKPDMDVVKLQATVAF